MQHIGISSLFLQPNRNGGTETYLRELLIELDKLTDRRITLFTSGCNHRSFDDLQNISRYRTPIQGTNRVIRIFYEQTILPWLGWHLDCDVLFYPGYLAPLWSPVPTVMTIPDTQYRDIPELIPVFQKLAYRSIIPLASRTAKKILTISNFSKHQIVKHEGISPDKIAVTAIAPKRTQGGQVANRPHPTPYLLTVSSALPHKNRPRLIQAFLEAKRNFNFPHSLVVLGGGQTQAELDIKDQQHVLFPGYVNDANLQQWYVHADGFILASLYEGVGLPVLEAMEAGVPVACSNIAALPEVAGQAAIFFDPTKIDSIAKAISELLLDQILRAKLIEQGKVNAAKFSWAACSSQTLKALSSTDVHF